MHIAKLMQVIPERGGRTGLEMVTGSTPDISELVDFQFYTLVWHYPKKHLSLTDEAKELARWVGVAQNVGAAMR